MQKRKPISCPQCGKDEGIFLHITGDCSLRAPVVEGKFLPSDELLLNSVAPTFVREPTNQMSLPLTDDDEEETIASLIPTSHVILIYSDKDGGTILTVHKNDATVRLYCPACSKVFGISDVPEYIGDGE